MSPSKKSEWIACLRNGLIESELILTSLGTTASKRGMFFFMRSTTARGRKRRHF